MLVECVVVDVLREQYVGVIPVLEQETRRDSELERLIHRGDREGAQATRRHGSVPLKVVGVISQRVWGLTCWCHWRFPCLFRVKYAQRSAPRSSLGEFVSKTDTRFSARPSATRRPVSLQKTSASEQRA